VCQNNADVPMADADDILIEALLDDVMDPTIVRDAIDEAVMLLQGDGSHDRLDRLDAELEAVESERTRLVTAIAIGGDLGGLLEALRTREHRRERLLAERASIASQAPLQAADAARVRGELTTLADSWRQVLVAGPSHARAIVAALLIGRVRIAPVTDTVRRWILRGEGTLRGLFSKTIFPLGVASPTGFEPVFWP